MPYRLLLACALIAAPVALLAQSAATQTTGQQVAAAQAGMDAQTFVEKAAISNMFEVESGELALEKAEDPKIRALAEEMVRDHGSASQTLESTLDEAGVEVRMPDQMDAEHRQKLEQLQAAEGAEFERMYLEMLAEGHEKDVSLFEQYAQSGDNDALKQFASETLPTLQEHKRDVEELKSGS